MKVKIKDVLLASPEYFAQEVFGLRMGSFHQSMLDFIGSGSRNLLLAPRGFGKSKVTQAYICWRILKDPNLRVLLVSASYDKSVLFMSSIKRALESKYIIDIFGDVRGDVWKDNAITLKGRTINHVEPGLMAIGGGSSSIVGLHEELLVMDDVTDYDIVRSDIKNRRLYEWFQTAALPTVTPNGQVVFLGTKYGLNDIYGQLDRMNYDKRIFPAVVNGVSACDWIRPMDDIIDDEGIVLEGLNTIKRNIGSTIFAMQFMNDTSLLMEGNIINHKWIQYYTNLPKLDEIVISCDPAISKGSSADSTAIVVLGRDSTGNIYVIDYKNDKYSFKETLDILESLTNQYKPEKLMIESVGFSLAFIQEMKLRIPDVFVDAVKATTDKESRLRAVSAIFENMLVYFKQNQGDIVDQLLTFPNAEHDDLVDAMSMGLRHYSNLNEGCVIF